MGGRSEDALAGTFAFGSLGFHLPYLTPTLWPGAFRKAHHSEWTTKALASPWTRGLYNDTDHPGHFFRGPLLRSALLRRVHEVYKLSAYPRANNYGLPLRLRPLSVWPRLPYANHRHREAKPPFPATGSLGDSPTRGRHQDRASRSPPHHDEQGPKDPQPPVESKRRSGIRSGKRRLGMVRFADSRCSAGTFGSVPGSARRSAQPISGPGQDRELIKRRG